MWVCSDCNQEFKQAGNHPLKHGKKEVKFWNKGLTKETSALVALQASKSSKAKTGKPLNYTPYSKLTLGERYEEINLRRVQKISEGMKKVWENDTYREEHLIVLKRNHLDPTRREKAREALRITGKNNKGKDPWNKGKKYKRKTPYIETQAIVEGRKRATEKKKQYRGAKASNWQGGKSLEEYGPEWTKELREFIRMRDNYQCQDCDLLQSQLEGFHRKLLIHHIDTDKHHCSPENLITLCISCHQNRHKTLRTKEPI